MPFSRLRGLLRRLRRDRRGNVLMIFGFAVIPLTIATGMGIDYGRAMRLQTKLNAAADAAALAAVSQYMMNYPQATGQLAAYQMFVTQTSGLSGLVINYNDTSQFNPVVTDSNGATNSRTAVVSYNAQSLNSFAGVLGLTSLTIKGSSQTYASQSPNIDFYVMMDTSPSMALPSTTAGLTQMTSLTGGCAFACHATADAYATARNGTATDYYGMAQSYGIPLRVDEEKTGVQNLMDTATTTEQTNHAVYRMSVNTYDIKNNFQTMQSLTTNLALAKTRSGNAQLLKVYANNYDQNGVYNSDTDTDFSDMFTHALALMPAAPGNGTNQAGDTPQAMLFIITDGMRDENVSGARTMGAVPTSFCDTVKNRGIRIAILDTDYLAASLSDGWSQSNVAPILPQVDPALQACASSGLYYKVTTDDDISAALSALFQKAVAIAHIIR